MVSKGCADIRDRPRRRSQCHFNKKSKMPCQGCPSRHSIRATDMGLERYISSKTHHALTESGARCSRMWRSRSSTSPRLAFSILCSCMHPTLAEPVGQLRLRATTSSAGSLCTEAIEGCSEHLLIGGAAPKLLFYEHLSST